MGAAVVTIRGGSSSSGVEVIDMTDPTQNHHNEAPASPQGQTLDGRYDVIVVGGGIAGLTAATYAAGDGARTLMLDAHTLGGRARTSVVEATTGVGSFRFNQGPHALYKQGETAAILKELRIPVSGTAPAGLHYWFDGAVHRMPEGGPSLLRTDGLHGKGKVAVAKFIATLPVLRAAPLIGVTVRDWFDGLGLPADALAFVEMLARTASYAHAPELYDAAAMLQQLQRAVRGVRYLDGGWQSIVDGLADRARQRGATIAHHVGVRTVDATAGGFEVRLTDDRSITAAAVVMACGSPAAMARLLGVQVQALGVPGPAVRASCLELGLAGPAEVKALFSADEPLYLSTHMPPARLGPEGTVHIGVARYLAADEQLAPDQAQAELWMLAQRAGITAESPSILARRYLHDMVVTHGMPLASEGGFDGRPPVAVRDHDGMFLAGDWVGPAGTLADGSAASGRAAGHLAAARAGTVARPGRASAAVSV